MATESRLTDGAIAQRRRERIAVEMVRAAGILDRMEARKRAADAAHPEGEKRADGPRRAVHHLVDQIVGLNRHRRLRPDHTGSCKPSRRCLFERNLGDTAGNNFQRRPCSRLIRCYILSEVAASQEGPRTIMLVVRSRILQHPLDHHLAQLNIGRIRYDVDDPRMADFTDNLALVNGIAERSPGFVWRHVDESGNAIDTRAFADPRIIVNFSVWENVDALERFVWQTVHKRFYGRRTDWFEPIEGPSVVLWWVPVGHRPSVAEAVARLAHLKRHGPDDQAFDWQTASAQLWKTARCPPAGQVA
jgi:Domain of unknown function (DUF3291)